MPDFKPTAEQNAIVDFAVNDTRNLCIEARAGAAKTTTLELLTTKLPSTEILYLAFNAAVQKEAAKRMPENVTCLTLHSLGYRAWAQMIPGRLSLDKQKANGNIRSVLEELSPTDRKTFDEEDMWDNVKEGCATPNRSAGSLTRQPSNEQSLFAEILSSSPSGWNSTLPNSRSTSSAKRTSSASIKPSKGRSTSMT
jgi:hypothetical protein